MLRRLVAAAAICVIGFTTAVETASAQAAGSAPTLVILVRHAEKADLPAGDPSLSEIGQARARALADALVSANVSAVVTSALRRTNETAGPLAQARGLTPEPISLSGPGNTHVNAVAAAVRKHAGEVVLVVGHSNTVPAIVTALGGPKLPDLCDASYATMFVMEIGGPKNDVRLVRSSFGAADPAGADQCQAAKPK